MSIPKPPFPPTPPVPGGVGPMPGPGSTTPKRDFFDEKPGEPKQSSLLPLFLAILVTVASAAIYLYRFELGANIWFWIGYALTPVASILLLGLESLLHVRNMQNDMYVRRRAASSFLKFVVILSCIPGVLHIIEIGQVLGEFVVQSGVAV